MFVLLSSMFFFVSAEMYLKCILLFSTTSIVSLETASLAQVCLCLMIFHALANFLPLFIRSRLNRGLILTAAAVCENVLVVANIGIIGNCWVVVGVLDIFWRFQLPFQH